MGTFLDLDKGSVAPYLWVFTSLKTDADVLLVDCFTVVDDDRFFQNASVGLKIRGCERKIGDRCSGGVVGELGAREGRVAVGGGKAVNALLLCGEIGDGGVSIAGGIILGHKTQVVKTDGTVGFDLHRIEIICRCGFLFVVCARHLREDLGIGEFLFVILLAARCTARRGAARTALFTAA